MAKLIIAIDDTDSNDGMCTTYIMTLIIEYLKDNNFEIIVIINYNSIHDLYVIFMEDINQWWLI